MAVSGVPVRAARALVLTWASSWARESHAPPTRRRIQAELRRYFSFCSRAHVYALPLGHSNALVYLSLLGESGRRLNDAGAALGLLSRLAGLPWAEGTYAAYLLLRRAANNRAAAPRRTHTVHAHDIVTLLQDPQRPPWARFTLAVATVAMLRPASHNAIATGDIRVLRADDGAGATLQLRLHHEKTARRTRRPRRVVHVPISAPLASLLCRLEPTMRLPSTPLTSGGALAPLRTALRALDVAWLPKYVRRAGCTAAYQRGFSLPEIKSIGGWTRDNTVFTHYIDATAPAHEESVRFLFRKPAAPTG